MDYCQQHDLYHNGACPGCYPKMTFKHEYCDERGSEIVEELKSENVALKKEVGRLDKGWEEASKAALVKALEVRKPVRWFAEQMERKLVLRDDRVGWDECELRWLLSRMGDEQKELNELLPLYARHDPRNGPCTIGGSNPADIIDECADVANFAMMIADKVYRRTRAILNRADPEKAGECNDAPQD